LNLEKSISNISKRLGLVEGSNKTKREAETDEEIEARFAKLRETRAPDTRGPDNRQINR
jgi:hypothetical protein